MVKFSAEILRFAKHGEKTGWTYVIISPEISQKINPGVKKAYRVKGKLDNYSIKAVAIMPMGGGDFILALNAAMRKSFNKSDGDTLSLQLELDTDPIEMDEDLMACLNEEPEALQQFNSMTPGHRNYFSKWIEGAKTSSTKAKRIAQTIDAMLKKWNYAEMIRGNKGTG